MLTSGLNFTFNDCLLFCFHTRECSTEQCFTKEKQYFELSHIPACFSLYWYPRGGCSCADGNNLPRWQSQKSIMPWTAWRTDTAQKHAMACGPLYIEPHHTSSAGTAVADENICSKTFCSTLLEIFISFLVISCCFPIHIPFLPMTVNNAYMNAFLYAHDKIISWQFFQTKPLSSITTPCSPPFLLTVVWDKEEGNKKMSIMVK